MMRLKSASSSKCTNIYRTFIFLVILGYFLWMFSILIRHDTRNNTEKQFPEVIATQMPSVSFVSVENINKSSHALVQYAKPSIFKTESDMLDAQLPSPKLFSQPAVFSTCSSSQCVQPAVLIVGGTDGSGTRRVVQTLTDLGVTMVSEDPETYDIHTDSVGGWPAVVKPVLEETHSLSYSPENLSAARRTAVLASLSRLLSIAERDSGKPTSHRLAFGGALPTPKGVTAGGVSFGFKAPVAMTLSPLWAHLLQHCKLLHVVRDGRDIAFSANQGPVDKFYSAMYGGMSAFGGSETNSLPVKAIRLWSDWNSQLHNWAQAFALRLTDLKDASKSFGYMTLHTEDLVSDSLAVRFSAVVHLARFVGSSLDERALCCLAQQGSEFMGSHDRSKVAHKDAQTQLASRYGKWREKLRSNRALSDAVYAAGREGLSLFGYEPQRSLPDESMTSSSSGYQCLPEENNRCREEAAAAAASKITALMGRAVDWVVAGMCTAEMGVDFKGDDIGTFDMPPNDRTSCCRKCRETPRCSHFTIDPAINMCYLKEGNSVQLRNNRLISGAVAGL